jgi:predicted nucleotidyltransferase
MRFHDPLFKAVNSDAKAALAKFLLTHDAAMSEREIASIVGLSHMSVNRLLREFAEMNLVHYSSVGKAHIWKVNKQSYVYQGLAKIFQSFQGLPGPLKELKKIILKNLSGAGVERIVLFGSVARGEEQFNSDIDLFVLVGTQRDKAGLEGRIEQLSLQCLDVFGNRLGPYVLSRNEFKQKRDLKLMESIERGIPIWPKEKDAGS